MSNGELVAGKDRCDDHLSVSEPFDFRLQTSEVILDDGQKRHQTQALVSIHGQQNALLSHDSEK